MRRVLPFAAMLMLLSGGALAAEAGTTCRTSHNLVGACFFVHGRLVLTKGTPRVRIGPFGTDRILAVLDRQSRAESDQVVPAAVNVLLTADPSHIEIYGEYEVCPFEKDTTGPIRAVCIESASHLIARRR